MQFNFSKHWEDSFFDHYNFRPLYDYCRDGKSIENYIKSLNWEQCDENGVITKVCAPQISIDSYKRDISNSLNIVTNQMIVYLYSRYEFMIEDFAKCIFINNPSLIIAIINEIPELKESLSFSLKEFLKSESKEAYVVELSSRISKRLLSKKPSNMVKRFASIAPINTKKSELDILDSLMEIRNKIVHEGYKMDIDFEGLDIYYRSLEEFLRALCATLRKKRVEIYDHGNLLDD